MELLKELGKLIGKAWQIILTIVFIAAFLGWLFGLEIQSWGDVGTALVLPIAWLLSTKTGLTITGFFALLVIANQIDTFHLKRHDKEQEIKELRDEVSDLKRRLGDDL